MILGGQMLDLQRPVVVAQLTNGEARVGRVGERADAEHVEVAQPDPGDLRFFFVEMV